MGQTIESWTDEVDSAAPTERAPRRPVPREPPTTTMNPDLESTLLDRLRLPYVVPSAIEDELEWFFEHGEKDIREPKPWDPECRWGILAYRVVGNWLSELDRYDAEVLKVAYATGPRPANLQKRLGRVTTLVVRQASYEAGWPEEAAAQEALERRTASRLAWQTVLHGPSVVRPYVAPAVGVLRASVRAYVKERGRGPSMAMSVATLQVLKEA